MILNTTAIIIECKDKMIPVRLAKSDDIEAGKTVYVPSPDNEWETGYVTHQDERGYILVDFEDDTREEYSHYSQLWVESEHCVLSAEEIEEIKQAKYYCLIHERYLKHLTRHVDGINAAQRENSLELYKLTCEDLKQFLEKNSKSYEQNKAKQKNLPRRQG